LSQAWIVAETRPVRQPRARLGHNPRQIERGRLKGVFCVLAARLGRPVAPTACSAAAPWTSTPSSAARPFAAGTRPSTAPSTSGCASQEPVRFYPFTFCRAAGKGIRPRRKGDARNRRRGPGNLVPKTWQSQKGQSDSLPGSPGSQDQGNGRLHSANCFLIKRG